MGLKQKPDPDPTSQFIVWIQPAIAVQTLGELGLPSRFQTLQVLRHSELEVWFRVPMFWPWYEVRIHGFNSVCYRDMRAWISSFSSAPILISIQNSNIHTACSPLSNQRTGNSRYSSNHSGEVGIMYYKNILKETMSDFQRCNCIPTPFHRSEYHGYGPWSMKVQQQQNSIFEYLALVRYPSLS